ncbi:hypothetical protein HDV02_004124 [Globomyces sp. JEL0801]|nr:hypothetical protein HDV02_004124 [Globomyces sp. JEL0801]
MVGLLCPNTKIILTGDHAKLQTIDKFTMFANHQLYCDCNLDFAFLIIIGIYIFLLARHFDRHGDIKFMLIQLVQKIPLIGQVVTIWDLLFMQRKLELDKFNILANMKRQREYASHLPLWMTPETRAKCREFAKKHDITEDPKYVLLPKSTGLFMVTDALKTQLNDCFDITIGYSGLQAVDIPMDYYMPGDVFFGQRYPKEIRVHVKHYQVNHQPGFDDQVIDPTKPLQPDSTTKNFVQIFDEKTDQRRLRFSNWVTKRFMEKDERMKDFYEDGGFDKAHQHAGYKTNEKDIWEVNPNANDVMLVLTTWVIGYTLANFYWWTFVKLISVVVTVSRFVLRI